MAKKLKDPTSEDDAAGKRASGSWGRLEQVFEERVARALGSIGVPTRADIDVLTRQVELLRETVARLVGQAGMAAALKPAAKKAAPRKRAAKTSSP